MCDGGEPGRSGYVNHSPLLFRCCALSSSDVYESLFALSDFSAAQVAMQLSWSFLGLWGTVNATAFHYATRTLCLFLFEMFSSTFIAIDIFYLLYQFPSL